MLTLGARRDVEILEHASQPSFNETGDGFAGFVEGHVAGPFREPLGDRNGEGLSLPFSGRLGLNVSVLVRGRGVVKLFLARHDRFVL